MDNLISSIFISSLISGFIFNPYIRNKYMTNKIHKEISQILKESVKHKKYEYHFLKSTENDFIRVNGWLLDQNNKNFKSAINKLNIYYEKVDIKDNKLITNNIIVIKPNVSSYKNEVEIEFVDRYIKQ